MAIDPRRRIVLDAIASAGGVTAASRVLHISPSAVSQHLAGMEREAGVALVDRTAGGIRLTPAGRALARRAAEVKDVLLAADNDLAAVTGRLSGVVNVAAYASIASRRHRDHLAGRRSAPPARGPPGPPTRPRNAVLLLIEALRAAAAEDPSTVR